jgi:hypothetical protein
MEKRIYFNCKINLEVPQRELRASFIRYLFHEHRVVYPEEDKGRLFNITAEIQFYNDNGENDIVCQVYFDKIEDLDDFILALSNMKNDWEARYKLIK